MISQYEAVIKELIQQIDTLKQDYPFNYQKTKTQVDEATKISEFKLIEEASNNTTLHHYYITILIECKRFYSRLQIIENILYGKLYDYFKYDSDKRLKNSDDYRRNIYAHPAWIKHQAFKEQVKTDIEYLQSVDKCFNERNYSLSVVAKLLQG